MQILMEMLANIFWDFFFFLSMLAPNANRPTLLVSRWWSKCWLTCWPVCVPLYQLILFIDGASSYCLPRRRPLVELQKKHKDIFLLFNLFFLSSKIKSFFFLWMMMFYRNLWTFDITHTCDLMVLQKYLIVVIWSMIFKAGIKYYIE